MANPSSRRRQKRSNKKEEVDESHLNMQIRDMCEIYSSTRNAGASVRVINCEPRQIAFVHRPEKNQMMRGRREIYFQVGGRDQLMLHKYVTGRNCGKGGKRKKKRGRGKQENRRDKRTFF